LALKRIMGIETEYGITGGSANQVVAAYRSKKKKSHDNFGKTNESVVEGMTDIGGHIGGDYGSISEQIAEIEDSDVGPGQTVLPEFSRTRFDSYGCSYNRFWTPNVSHRKIYTPRVAYSYAYDPDDIIDNGSRFYVDMGHPELSTAETSNPRDLVIYDKAGELIVLGAAKKTGRHIKIYKNNSDGQGNSYGCHENYLLKRFSSEEFQKILVPALLPFLVTRQIFAGSGKIGIEDSITTFSGYGYTYNYGYQNAYYNNKKTKPEGKRSSPRWRAYERQRDRTLEAIAELGKHFLDIPQYSDVEKMLKRLIKKREQLGEQEVYQISQRADFFEQIIGLQTTHNRPIINTRDEPHADKNKYMRLHVICGDANLSEVSTYLKTGTTALVLDLIEDGLAPSLKLKKPTKQIQNISRDQSRKWLVELEDKKIPAVDIQRMYLDAAIKAYAGRDKITDDILQRWEHTLDALEKDPMQLSTSIDWVIKLNLLTHLMDKKGIGLNDDVIRNAALQYHDVSREEGLFYYLQNNGLVERLVSDEEIEHAVLNPPEDTRAYLRSRVGELEEVTKVDWGGFHIKEGGKTKIVHINEPFSGTKEDVGHLFDNYTTPTEFVKELAKIEGIDVRNKWSIKRKPKKQAKTTRGGRTRESGLVHPHTRVKNTGYWKFFANNTDDFED